MEATLSLPRVQTVVWTHVHRCPGPRVHEDGVSRSHRPQSWDLSNCRVQLELKPGAPDATPAAGRDPQPRAKAADRVRKWKVRTVWLRALLDLVAQTPG